MKFIQVFDTDTKYKIYRNSIWYAKPNVSYSRDVKEVHYNYPPTFILNANGHEYVDLDLPSGTRWATMNVGASKPSDYGKYFQWGDTQGYTKDQVGTGSGKKAFLETDYKWSINGSTSNFSKYTTSGATLELADDAANANMGGDWHMPTPTQIQELINNTTSTLTTQDGVNGRLFTSKKDSSKSIFIPAADLAWDGAFSGSGDGGYVWSSMLGASSASNGQYLYFYSSNVNLKELYRCNGCSVRGVLG